LQQLQPVDQFLLAGFLPGAGAAAERLEISAMSV
jgi:hypothetical protein